jgi:hypothetical protein
MTQGLEQRIASALAEDDINSSDLAALIAETEHASAAAGEAAERERERALDPAAVVDAAEARTAMEHAAFVRQRLHAALPRLQARLDEVRTQETLAAWGEDFKKVEVRRDALATELAETYPMLAKKLIDLLNRIAAIDKEVGRINGSAPYGANLRLREVELEARGLDRFTLDTPSIAKELRLPHFDRSSGQPAWPPPPALPDFAAITCAAHDPRYSADWGTVAEAKERQIRKAQDAAELASLENAIAAAERLGGGATWWVPREQERLRRLRAAVQASGG